MFWNSLNFLCKARKSGHHLILKFMFSGELSYSLTKYSQPKMLSRKINDCVITSNSRKSHEVESGKTGVYIYLEMIWE